ncbi:MAG: hypothetical protein WCH75_28175 [Candidatus Binatia bacterium]
MAKTPLATIKTTIAITSYPVPVISQPFNNSSSNFTETAVPNKKAPIGITPEVIRKGIRKTVQRVANKRTTLSG